MTLKILRIGTRGSPLALAQTKMVEKALAAAHPDLTIQKIIIKTSGDWNPADGEKKLSETEGGKGLFAREIEKALQGGSIDCAVHSMKDMPSFLPDSLALDHVLARGDVRDAFICHNFKTLQDLPKGAVVGTSSARRQSIILSQRPDIKIVPLRGNVQTRLDKLAAGQVEATYLAMAGLSRLSITGDFIHPLGIGEMLPACGQGIVAIETRASDEATRSLLNAIHHHVTGLCGLAERAALQTLDGSCHTPIGAHARIVDGRMMLTVMVASEDGKDVFEESVEMPAPDIKTAIMLGKTVGQKLKDSMPPRILH